jgi:hypothetical protein
LCQISQEAVNWFQKDFTFKLVKSSCQLPLSMVGSGEEVFLAIRTERREVERSHTIASMDGCFPLENVEADAR